MKKLYKTKSRYSFYCPACKTIHQVTDIWSVDMEAVTIQPSVKVLSGGETKSICHSFVTDGNIQYLGDCTHGMSGDTVSLPEFKMNEDGSYYHPNLGE